MGTITSYRNQIFLLLLYISSLLLQADNALSYSQSWPCGDQAINNKEILAEPAHFQYSDDLRQKVSPAPRLAQSRIPPFATNHFAVNAFKSTNNSEEYFHQLPFNVKVKDRSVVVEAAPENDIFSDTISTHEKRSVKGSSSFHASAEDNAVFMDAHAPKVSLLKNSGKGQKMDEPSEPSPPAHSDSEATPTPSTPAKPIENKERKRIISAFVDTDAITVGLNPFKFPTIKPLVEDYDSLYINFKYSNYLEVPIVRGSPFINFLFTSGEPLIHVPHLLAVKLIDAGTDATGATGQSFLIHKKRSENSSEEQTYVVHFTKPVTLTREDGLLYAYASDRDAVYGKFTGLLQVGFVGVGLLSAEDAKPLSSAFGSYAYKPKIRYCLRDEGKDNDKEKVAYVNFQWNEKSATGKAQGQLRMISLPHHQRLITNLDKGTALQKTRSGMSLMSGGEWLLAFKVMDPGLAPCSNDVSQIPEDKKHGIVQQVNADLSQASSELSKASLVDRDVEYSGKIFSKYARLLMISESLNSTKKENAKKVRKLLKSGMASWFQGLAREDTMKRDEKYQLFYDTVWGGLYYPGTSSSASKKQNDFSLYGGHHRSLGYFLYTYSYLARKDAVWRDNYKGFVLDFVRDIANPSTKDTYFPIARHKDFYTGLSHSSGLASNPYQYADSYSEAIHSYYSIQQLGKSLHHRHLHDLGAVFLWMEVESLNEYRGALLKDSCSYALNMMPFSSMSPYYINEPWTSKDKDKLESFCTKGYDSLKGNQITSDNVCHFGTKDPSSDMETLFRMGIATAGKRNDEDTWNKMSTLDVGSHSIAKWNSAGASLFYLSLPSSYSPPVHSCMDKSERWRDASESKNDAESDRDDTDDDYDMSKKDAAASSGHQRAILRNTVIVWAICSVFFMQHFYPF